MAKRILVLGDTHFPFAHKKAFEWVYRVTDKLRPDTVLQLGDLLDQFAFSRYPKVLKMDPEEELARGRADAEKMWARFKGLDCVQLLGNHCVRLVKKAVSSAPEFAHLAAKSTRELHSFSGVRTYFDDREEVVLDVSGQKVMFQHGHRSKLGDHCRFNLMNTVCGHSHRGGVVWEQNINGAFWELNAGFLGDISSYVFGYRAQKAIHKTTLGIGWLDEYGPRFMPYAPVR